MTEEQATALGKKLEAFKFARSTKRATKELIELLAHNVVYDWPEQLSKSFQNNAFSTEDMKSIADAVVPVLENIYLKSVEAMNSIEVTA